MSSEQLDSLAQELSRAQALVVISGAGVSAESGISTFRGLDGYWQRFNPQELASPEGFRKDPELVWRWYDERRRQILKARPNPAHQAIAELEQRFKNFLLISQNVDGLHQQAGSEKLIEIHGSIWRVRCTRSGQEWANHQVFDVFPVRCQCGALLRPAVLWFGESYQPELMQQALRAARQASHVLVVGTSGQVWIVSGLLAEARRARSAEFNLEATDQQTDYLILGPAGQTLPALLARLNAYSA